jgi:Flp pilus assembly secretin CpaC
MKTLLITLLAAMPLIASADSFLITAKVLDRASDGSAIRELYVYPSVVLESGETAKLHIGPELQFPIGSQTVDLGNGVSKEETIYETIPVGLSFTLTYTQEEGVVAYTAKAVSKVSLGTSGEISEIASKETIFYGKTELGGIVEAQMTGGDGTPETIAFHFGPAPDAE